MPIRYSTLCFSLRKYIHRSLSVFRLLRAPPSPPPPTTNVLQSSRILLPQLPLQTLSHDPHLTALHPTVSSLPDMLGCVLCSLAIAWTLSQTHSPGAGFNQRKRWDGMMHSLVRCSPPKHGDLSLTLQNPHKYIDKYFFKATHGFVSL